ncbi:MAG: kelch repeat-containing protein [Chitinophagaceae bacterium]
MKTTLTFIALLLCATVSHTQINSNTPWTWMKGDNTIEKFGIYGIQGTPDPINKPGARNSSATWKDATGNLWLFGGWGYGNSTTSGYLNDLWKYNPLNNQWTWVKGNNVTGQYSIYGTQGTADIANKPGGTYASVSWTDADNNLWLFGGFGLTDNAFGFLNALWKYNSASNQWTWVKGNNTINEIGVYGSQGIEHAANKPGARYGSKTWTDASGNLWLFGGYGYDGNAFGMLNDLWKYNPTTNKWTWIKGDNLIDQPGVYGTKGIANGANKPGARYVSTSWKDASGNLWLFGGYGKSETDEGNLNDLWKYNPITNEWTWINGDKINDQVGSYGTQGVASPTNKPGARYTCSSWKDAGGDLWMFGGYGYDATSTGYLNDLWKYDLSTNKWTWVKGDNTVDHVGIYGTQGMPDTSNKSGGRTGSVSWTDDNGNLWLFGGYGFDGNTSGVLNDLWKISSFQIPLPVHLLNFSGVLNNETVHLQWLAELETGFSHFNIERSFDGINFLPIGNVNGAGNSNRNNYTYTDNDLNNRPAQKVFYHLQMMDKDGKFSYSRVLRFNWKKQGATITAFPNPAVTSLTISFDQSTAGKVMITISDMQGVNVRKQEAIFSAGSISIPVDVHTLPAATYLLSVITGEGARAQQKFIKQ